MTIQAEEAASALKDAEVAAGRATAAHAYRIASGFLILWGAIWAVANVACQVSPHLGQTVWTAGSLVGVAGSVILGSRRRGARGKGGWLKALLVALAIGGFGAGVSIIAPPLSFAQGEAIACLAVGAIYVAMGAGGGPGLRLSAVGAALIVATLVGWLFAREQFFAWMAAAGGGGLILGGLWLRKV
jgi:hypothetical protein